MWIFCAFSRLFRFFPLSANRRQCRPAAVHQQAKDNCGNLLKFIPLNFLCIIRERNERHYEDEKNYKANFLQKQGYRGIILYIQFSGSPLRETAGKTIKNNNSTRQQRYRSQRNQFQQYPAEGVLFVPLPEANSCLESGKCHS